MSRRPGRQIKDIRALAAELNITLPVDDDLDAMQDAFRAEVEARLKHIRVNRFVTYNGQRFTVKSIERMPNRHGHVYHLRGPEGTRIEVTDIVFLKGLA